MNQISHDQLKTALRYCVDTGVFTWLAPTSNRVKIGAPAGVKGNHGYLVIGLNGTKYLAHRLAWFYSYGTWPLGEIDHIDRNRQNNSLVNLRDTTRGENALNVGARMQSSSGIKGVSWDKVCNRWRVQMRVKGKQTYIGVFKTLDEATVAYERFAVTYRT